MFATVFRVLAGFIIAALAAAAVTVAFVITPADLAGLTGKTRPDLPGQFLMLTLLAATHSAIFAAPFVLIAAIIGEWQGVRGLGYYLLAGSLIGLGGFAAQYVSETGAAASIANNYALKAFLTAGFAGGLVYWMAAGRAAGGRAADRWAAEAAKLPRIKVGNGEGSVPPVPKDGKPGAAKPAGGSPADTKPSSPELPASAKPPGSAA